MHRFAVALLLAAAAAAQQPPAGELVPGRTLALAVAKDAAPLRLSCAVAFPGGGARLTIFAAGSGCDPSLTVEDAAGRQLARDDDSGGGRDACASFDLAEPARLTLQVDVRGAEPGARLRLRCTVAFDTEATRAAAAAADAALERIETLLDAGDAAAARARLAAAARALEATPGAAQSPAVAARWPRLLAAAMRSGELDVAARVAEANRRRCDDALPDDHRLRQRALSELAEVVRARGDLPAALLLQRSVVDTFERTLPADDRDLAVARANLASLFADLGELGTARELQQRVVAEFARHLPEDHPQLLLARGNLAATLAGLGDLLAAKAMQDEVIAAWTRRVPAAHPALQSARVNLARTLTGLGDLDGARLLLEDVLAIRARTLPAGHPQLQTTRSNLAAVLVGLGQVDAAAALLQQSIAGLAKLLPPGHPHLVAARQGLAAILAQQGRWAEAEALFADAVQQLQQRLADADPELFAARVNLGTCLADAGETEAARAALQAALQAAAAMPATPERAQAEAQLAQVLARLGDEAALPPLLRRLASGLEQRLLEYGVTLAPRQCAAAVQQARGAMSTVLALAPGCRSAGLDAAAFGMVEAARGLSMAAHAVGRSLFGLDAGAARLLAERRTAIALQRRRIADLQRSGADAGALQQAIAAREAEQAAFAAACRRFAACGDALQPVTPASVASQLQPDDAALAYWRGRDGDRPVYLAFVVLPDGSLHRADLGAAAAIDDGVRAFADAVRPGGDGEEAARRQRAMELGRELRRRLVDPVRQHAGAAKRWFLAADAALHLLPFDALPEDGDGCVGDRQLVVEVHSLRRLRSGPRAGGGLVVVGGIDYGEPPSPAPATVWTPLPASRAEVAAVVPLFAAAHPEAQVVNLGDRGATAAALTAAVPGAAFLHIATHAWFAPPSLPSLPEAAPLPRVLDWGRSTGSDLVPGFSPMLLCGLALSAANRGGVITAEEVAALDLSACNLAVLSGCETGLGLGRSGQGLASLQQALHIAGARASVTSLWSVPDRATRTLMTAFYTALWRDQLPPERALWQAKRSLRLAVDGRGQPRHGIGDWAGWVLSGTW